MKKQMIKGASVGVVMKPSLTKQIPHQVYLLMAPREKKG